METVLVGLGAPIATIVVCIITMIFSHNSLKKEVADLRAEIDKRDAERERREDEKDKAREEMSITILDATNAAIALGEATAKAVQRIPDAHCNGDMHDALDYARIVKHRQRDFLTKSGVKYVHEND